MNSPQLQKESLAVLIRAIAPREGLDAKKIVCVANATYGFKFKVARYESNKMEKWLIILGKPFIDAASNDSVNGLAIIQEALRLVKAGDGELVKKIPAIVVSDNDFDYEVTVTAKHRKYGIILSDSRSDFRTHESITAIHQEMTTIMVLMAENL